MTIKVYRDIAADDTELLSIRQDLGGGIADIVEMPIPEVPAFLAEVKRVAGIPEEPRPAIWYLGSPYTSASEAVQGLRYRQVCQAAARLFERSILVYSPIAHTVAINAEGQLDSAAFEFWREFDLGMIDRLTGLMVLMIDGWQDSKGLAAEIAHARATGKSVLWCEPELVDGHVVGYVLHEDTVPAGVEA